MDLSFIYKKIGITLLTISTIVMVIFAPFFVPVTFAAINKQINYQGKLTNSSNVSVADGTYTMEFNLYTVATGGSPVWTETLTSTNKVQVTNGLFSVMLGSTTPFTGVDFNQTLYLGVKIEADSEMTPRKIIGSVPSAFVADTVDNISSEQFLRADIQNSTSTSGTFLNILQSGAGKVAEFFGAASQSVLALLSNGNVGIGTTSPFAKLSVAGVGSFDALVRASSFTATSTTASIFPYASTTALTVSGTNGLSIGSLTGPLQALNGVVSASSTLSTFYGGTGISTAPSYGQVLLGNASGGYTLTATSSLGITSGGVSFAYPFALTGNATSTLTQFNGGLTAFASSTIGNGTASGGLTISGNSTTTGTAYFGGNLLIGTTTPISNVALQVTPTSGNGFLLFDSGAITQATALTMYLGNRDVQQWNAAGDFVFNTQAYSNRGTNTGGTEVYRISSTTRRFSLNQASAGSLFSVGGNAAIGSTFSASAAPTNSLIVEGSIGVGTSTYSEGLTVSTAATPAKFCRTGGSGCLSISQNNIFSVTGRDTQFIATPLANAANPAGISFYVWNGASSLFAGGFNHQGRFAIGTTSPGVELSVVGRSDLGNSASAGFFTATTSTASTFPYASTTALSATTICLSTNCRSSWPTSGNNTWSTTTSTVNGQLVNYSNNTSDIVTIGSNSTTTAKFWFDPNFSLARVTGRLDLRDANNAIVIGGLASSGTRGANSIDIQSDLSNAFNFNEAAASTLIGYGNYNASPGAASTTIVGYKNGANSSSSFLSSIFGTNNYLDSSSPNSVLIGNDNYIYNGPEASAVGVFNDIENGAYRASAFGYGNYVYSTGSSAFGYRNGIDSPFASSTAIGYNNIISAASSTVIGSYITNSITNSFMAGVNDTAKLTILSTGETKAPYFTATTSTASTFPYASTTALTVSGTNGLSIGSLTGPLQALNGVVSASSTLSTFYGGTGISTAPSYGQVLLGNASGGYTLTATSSLGITSGGVSFAYPFALTGNATSTLTQFNGGLTAFASSTIGNGTASGGLTISGNSTTTGTAYFGGNVGVGTSTPNNIFQVLNLIDFNNTDLNTKIGYQAGKNITAGAASNTFVGYQSGLSSSTASTNVADNNTGFGYQSLLSNTTGDSNTANGVQSLYNNTIGTGNSAYGVSSLYSNTAGIQNSAFGVNALVLNTTGSTNTAIGFNSGLFNSGGSGNVFVGYYAGGYETTSDNFYLDNRNRTTTAGDKAGALLYGKFNAVAASQTLTINASTSVSQDLSVFGGLAVSGNSTTTGNSYFGSNVGIGTSSPSARFSMNGAGTGTGRLFALSDSANAEKITILDNGNFTMGTGQTLRVGNVTANNGAISTASGGLSIGASNGVVTVASGNRLTFGGTTSSFPALNQNGSSLYLQLADGAVGGNFGIGTSSPFAKLSVHANNGETNTTLFNISSSTASATTSLFTVLNTGAVGIGTANPGTDILKVSGGTVSFTSSLALGGALYANSVYGGQNAGNSLTLQASSNNPQSGFVLIAPTTGLAAVGTTTPYSKFSVWGLGTGTGQLFSLVNSASSTLVQVLDNGNFGIGTTSPFAKLSVHANNGETNKTLFTIASSTANATTSLFTVLNNGNVGIGTSSPFGALSVQGTTDIPQLYVKANSSQTANLFQFLSSSGSNALSLSNGGTLSGGLASFSFGSFTANGGGSSVVLTTTGASAQSVDIQQWARSGVGTLAVINKDGNFGIGTTSPFAKLSVHANNGETNLNLFAISSSTPTATSTFVVVDRTGDVGIGSSTPTAKLSIGLNGTDTFQANSFEISSTTVAGVITKHLTVTNAGMVTVGNTLLTNTIKQNTFGALTISNDSGGGPNQPINFSALGYLFNAKTNGLIVADQNSLNLFNVQSTGNVGIGTSTPFAKFSVVGQAVAAYFTATTSTTSTFPYASTTALTVSGTTYLAGNVGVGTTSPYAMLSVAGGVALPGVANGAGTAYLCTTLSTGIVSTSTTACNPSSIRFKDNVANLSSDYGILDVMKLRPVSYVYKPGMLIQGNQIGFIAEEVSTIIPEVVGYDSLGMPANIDYAKLTPVLTKAIQDIGSTINILGATSTLATMTISPSGNVGIGTVDPSYKLHVLGDIAATSFVNISTRTSKKDIQYISADEEKTMLEKLKTISVAKYHYISEDQSNPLRLGLIAEEVPSEILAVGGKGVDIYKLATFTLGAVQAQQSAIEKLQIRIENLEKALAQGTTTALVLNNTASSTTEVFVTNLKSFGAEISNGILSVKKMVVASLSVGSETKQGGITLYDKEGKPACLVLENASSGQIRTLVGTCEDAMLGNAVSSVPTPAPLVTSPSPLVITPVESTPASSTPVVASSTPIVTTPSVVTPPTATTPVTPPADTVSTTPVVTPATTPDPAPVVAPVTTPSAPAASEPAPAAAPVSAPASAPVAATE